MDSNVPTAESVRTGQPVLVRRDEVDERYPDLGGFADGTGSILCLPLAVAGGRVLGAVSLSFPGRRAISEAENLFLQLLADTCAMTIDRVDAQRAAATGRPSWRSSPRRAPSCRATWTTRRR